MVLRPRSSIVIDHGRFQLSFGVIWLCHGDANESRVHQGQLWQSQEICNDQFHSSKTGKKTPLIWTNNHAPFYNLLRIFSLFSLWRRKRVRRREWQSMIQSLRTCAISWTRSKWPRSTCSLTLRASYNQTQVRHAHKFISCHISWAATLIHTSTCKIANSKLFCTRYSLPYHTQQEYDPFFRAS